MWVWVLGEGLDEGEASTDKIIDQIVTIYLVLESDRRP